MADPGGRTPVTERLERWLRDPSAQKPTAHMPRLDLTEPDVRALAAYLSTLK